MTPTKDKRKWTKDLTIIRQYYTSPNYDTRLKRLVPSYLHLRHFGSIKLFVVSCNTTQIQTRNIFIFTHSRFAKSRENRIPWTLTSINFKLHVKSFWKPHGWPEARVSPLIRDPFYSNTECYFKQFQFFLLLFVTPRLPTTKFVVLLW